MVYKKCRYLVVNGTFIGANIIVVFIPCKIFGNFFIKSMI